MIWLPSVKPICASSPAAWIAVPTSSPPLGGRPELGLPGAGRSLPVSSFGAPARTARGPAAAGGVGALVALGSGRAGALAAVFLAGLRAFAAGPRDAGRPLLAADRRGLAALRSPPIRDGRVAGRLASTLGWSAFLAFFAFLGLAVLSVIQTPSLRFAPTRLGIRLRNLRPRRGVEQAKANFFLDGHLWTS
jgi:hypothetical protein